ncbi:2-C-methyl-D-erythritol 4-phosphate cytidylyltransferase IspD [Peptoclostridium acidaminophilum DSM 3953]|uniref:2-C-methyl-D-erythritol 4-phosphate cytidylyltransferase n=1 Tax=Peptoclostridium acidaminophilum DSM 3953 TaxID=1286171 RepID=W8T155_PEPAC|nr:2-C-methyl-D-erythritol 4-phosphate cytidylyltransferase [Peptoclostridium acidaminophilum]AHM55464.1 2-C-methyl-D-erythritol 4-phosphate cytidylyltransferase IspD [Peptoclostridium acidaminophilum DSM 3953]
MNSVVIVGAGKGKRMKSDINKVYLRVAGKPVLQLTIEKFMSMDEIDELVVVISRDDEEIFGEMQRSIYISKPLKIAYGGAERRDSVYNGLRLVDTACDVVLIHDAARPLVDKADAIKSIECARENGACALAVRVKDTVKIADDEGFVESTPERDKLWAVQTPQTFKYKLIMEAYRRSIEEGLMATDDCMMAESAGFRVKLVEGSYENIKITTPEDMLFAKEILKRM